MQVYTYVIPIASHGIPEMMKVCDIIIRIKLL